VGALHYYRRTPPPPEILLMQSILQTLTLIGLGVFEFKGSKLKVSQWEEVKTFTHIHGQRHRALTCDNACCRLELDFAIWISKLQATIDINIINFLGMLLAYIEMFQLSGMS
jgi:hypothetical protein